MLFGGTDLFRVDTARELIESEQNTAQQIAFSTRHSFFDGNAIFARIVFPAPQNFDFLLLRHAFVAQEVFR